MNTEQNKLPLWKELNEKRTKGEWCSAAADINRTKFFNLIYGCSNERNGTGTLTITRTDSDPIWNYESKEAEANSKYIAICVNNFADVVEALEQLLDECNKRDIKRSYNTPAEITAIQVLNNIK